MPTPKIYYITESQFKALIERKKSEKVLLSKILEEISQKKKSLNEAAAINEGIIDTIKNYVRKGMITTALISSLLASNQVNAQQLQAAGVPKAQIEQAINKEGGSSTESQIPLEKIESHLLHAMKRAGLDGSIASYQKLTPEQKQKILTGIQGNIKSLDDVDKFNRISIGGWTKTQQGGDNTIEFDQQHQIKMTVDTSSTIVSVPLINFFNKNSAQLSNPEELKTYLEENFNNFTVIDSVVVTTSSSTLRNTGEAEGMTWKELSQKRAESIINVVKGTEYDLGGQGVNPKQVITADMIKINTNGTNGDGSSGPKSPYEVNPQVVAAYQQRGIDPIYWKSAATEAPLQNTAEYEKFQKADIIIYGRIVTTNTEDVPSYRYIVMNVAQEGGKMKVNHDTKKADISKCPVKFKVAKTNVPKGSVLQGMHAQK